MATAPGHPDHEASGAKFAADTVAWWHQSEGVKDGDRQRQSVLLRLRKINQDVLKPFDEVV